MPQYNSDMVMVEKKKKCDAIEDPSNPVYLMSVQESEEMHLSFK
jgi:hypothetical protein